ncbi:hypothetical protein QNI16_21650 [Cytophagaceae bacterium YF14B1]|uniref:Uncharacterized protein n=1 Tax=Xanthocytophaga flava TaxID=3048013 RepID=A0AAE3QTK4_9BACT|nr:hypothetical protein [Xanthocytophaga flavus]MDJ1483118.1 hypothetical protein [Xanthocytophaga flavus]
MWRANNPVDLTKYYQLLEADEIAILRKDRVIPISTAVFLLFFIGIWIFVLLYTSSLYGRILGCVLFSIAFLGFVIRIYRRRQAFREDMDNGYKVVYTGPIESKRESSLSRERDYYFTILGIEFDLSYNEWKDLQVNQMVQIHLAPKSKHILKLTTLD